MKIFPDDLELYKRTPEFNQTNIPAGLLRNHSTKAGVWALIVVVSGQLRYRTLSDGAEYLLSPTQPGVVAPEALHMVEPIGEVLFHVEFYRDKQVLG